LNKKALFLIAVVIIAILGYLLLRPAAPTIVIDHVYDVTEVGQTVNVTIRAIGLPSCSAWVFNLVWDPYILQITTGDNQSGLRRGGIYYNIYEGPYLESIRPTIFLANNIDNGAGKIDHLVSGYQTTDGSASGDGALVTINFTVVHVGTTTIEITGTSPGFPGKGLIQSSNPLEEVPHDEIYGLVTENAPPPIWSGLEFQIETVVIEVAILAVVSYVVIRMRRPKPPLKTEEITETSVPEE